MFNGYVKLFRKTIKSRVFASEGLLKVWIWCLLKANHDDCWVSVTTGKGTTEVHLNPGEFIYGRNAAGKELKMKPSTVHDRMMKLKNMQNIGIQSDTHYSIITIINWDSYQSENVSTRHSNRQPTDNQPTTNRQPTDTDKNDKNDKNNKKSIRILFVEGQPPLDLAMYFFDKIKGNNPKAKVPNFQAWAKIFDLMLQLDKREEADVQAVIDWCQDDEINGWQWSTIILSPKKLREKFDQLYSKMSKISQSKKTEEEINLHLEEKYKDDPDVVP